MLTKCHPKRRLPDKTSADHAQHCLIERKSLNTGEKEEILLSHVLRSVGQLVKRLIYVHLGEDWSLPHWLWWPPMLSLYISRH